MSKAFRDEQQETDDFEELCGGVAKAQRLLHLYQDSYPNGTAYDFLMGRGATKEQVFEAKAKREGFTAQQVNAFRNLQ
jgi:hypothetical protein